MSGESQLPWAEAERPGEFVLTFDARAYSIEAIQRAAFWLTDRCYVSIEMDGSGQFSRVRVAAKHGELSRTLAGELGNRVLDEELRRQVLAETRLIREAIVTQAFAEADLGDHRGAPFAEDPEGIGPA